MIEQTVKQLRTALKDVPSESITIFIERLTKIRDERHQQEVQDREQEQLRQKALSSIVKLASESGIGTDELVVELKKRENTNKRSSAKYQFINDDGELQTWSGQGRIPTPMKKQMEEQEVDKDHFLIKLPSDD